jgi:hypothetical protein
MLKAAAKLSVVARKKISRIAKKRCEMQSGGHGMSRESPCERHRAAAAACVSEAAVGVPKRLRQRGASGRTLDSSLKRSADKMMTKEPTRESSALPSTMYLHMRNRRYSVSQRACQGATARLRESMGCARWIAGSLLAARSP